MKIEKNFAILIILVLLTVVSVLFAHYIKADTFYSILLGGIKFILIAFFFMEVRHAHILWRLTITTIVGIFILLYTIWG